MTGTSTHRRHRLHLPVARPLGILRSGALLLGAVLLGALLLPAGCHKAAEDAPTPAVEVQAEHPERGAISEEIAADATLAPLSQAAIAPRISAPIRAEYVQRGDPVHRGQLLLTLQDGDLRGAALDSQGALTAARASYTATANGTVPEQQKKAELDVAQAQAARDVAVRTSAERRKLFEQGALSGRDADTALAAAVAAQATYDNAKKHLEAFTQTLGATTAETAQGQLESARGRLLSAQAQVGYAQLRSPIDGVVTERPLFPGETASAGAPVITVMDTSSLLAKLHLAQASAVKLGVGHKAAVTVPGRDEPVEATVSFISPALDPGSTTVEVWLKLPNPRGRLKVGTPVHALIQGDTVPGALQVPLNAILPAQDGGTSVLVVGTDGAVHKRAVTVGIRTSEKAQIVSGVSPGDMVVTSGGYGLDDGTKVTLGKPAAGTEKD